MKLFEASWDGDVIELMCILETGVSVDITRPVCHQNTSHCCVYTIAMHTITQGGRKQGGTGCFLG